MATFDSALGMWKDKSGGYHSTQSEATAADRNLIDDDQFVGPGGIDVAAPDAIQRDDPGDAPNPNNPGGLSDNEIRRRRNTLSGDATRTANINAVSDRTSGTFRAPIAGSALDRFHSGAWAQGGATGAYEAGSDTGRDQFDYMHELGSPGAFSSPRQLFNSMGERAGVSRAGSSIAFTPGVSFTPAGLARSTVQRPARTLGTTADGLGGRPVAESAATFSARSDPRANPFGLDLPGATTGPPSFDQGAGRTGVDQETEDAKNRAGNTIEENRDENAQLFADAFGNYENLQDSDYGMSDEARGYQREGLAQQRMLLEKMLGFDPNQYATRYADQTLARQIAAGRSAGGGYASQQAGTMAAMEQAPALYAEGARQASQLETQRLQGAEAAAKGFGDLGTMTRGQDEQRAQFESNLGLSIADSVARLTEGNVQMNDRDSAQMAEIWMDFAKLQSVYAGMSSDEQLAWWQQETARRGQDQNFEAIMAQLKSQGEISSKDLIGGLFQLGGGLMSAGGTMGAAYITGQAAQKARAA